MERDAASRKTNRFFGSRDLQLYSLIAASVVFLAIFNYLPMFGLIFAFKDGDGSLNIMNGMLHSDWTFDNFTRLFADKTFWEVFANTVVINLLFLVFNFPMPVIFALLLNEINTKWFKKTVQTISTLPHFISWTVFGGIVLLMTDMNIGIINPILELLGLSTPENPVDLNLAQYFYPKIIIASVIKSTGWGSIIYIAAIAGIDQSLYEAAKIDGAGRFRQAISITLPEIRPTILVYLLLNISTLLSNSFEQFYVFQNVANLSRTRVLATYMYNLGFTYRKYSTATALSLCEGALSLFLLMSTNWLAKKFTGEGILY